jgi:hypothetical protein
MAYGYLMMIVFTSQIVIAKNELLNHIAMGFPTEERLQEGMP